MFRGRRLHVLLGGCPEAFGWQREVARLSDSIPDPTSQLFCSCAVRAPQQHLASPPLLVHPHFSSPALPRLAHKYARRQFGIFMAHQELTVWHARPGGQVDQSATFHSLPARVSSSGKAPAGSKYCRCCNTLWKRHLPHAARVIPDSDGKREGLPTKHIAATAVITAQPAIAMPLSPGKMEQILGVAETVRPRNGRAAISLRFVTQDMTAFGDFACPGFWFTFEP